MGLVRSKYIAYIFGAGDEKIGTGVGYTPAEVPALLKSKSLAGKLRFKKRIMGNDYEEPNERTKCFIAKGAMVKKKFEDAIVGLKYLKEDMTAIAKERGWIKCITGAKLIARKPHAALNTRLQGSGAAACKVWDIECHRLFKAAGLVLGKDYVQMLWVHDELQFAHRKGLGPTIRKLANEAAANASKIIGLRGTLRTEGKTGRNWAETH